MEDLIKDDATFELFYNSEGASLLNNRVLTTYPSEKSSFQIDLGEDGYFNFDDDINQLGKEGDTTKPKQIVSDVDTEKLAESITATAGAIGSIGATVQAFKGNEKADKKPRRRKLLREECGKKPLNKKKREEYNTCVNDYNAGKRGGVIDTQTNTDTETDSTPSPPPNNKNKIIIGLVVVGVLAGVFFAYKKGLFGAKAV